jgi:hypothetical protein
MAREIKLKNGQTALFDDDASNAFINKTLKDAGLERASDSMLAKINEPIVSGVASILGLPGAYKAGVSALETRLERMIGDIIGKPVTRPVSEVVPDIAKQLDILSYAPTPSQIQESVRAAGVPMARAESIPGQALQNFIRNLVATPVPGAAIPSALSAVGEEAFAYPFRGTEQEPFFRATGAVTAPLAAIPLAMRSPAQTMIREEMARVTPAERAQAEAMMREAPTPITPIEAIQRATGEARGMEAGGITRLPQVQQMVETSRVGGPIMQEFLAGREATTRQALEQQFPQVPRETLQLDVQEAAKAAERAAQKEVSRVGGPAFQAIDQTLVPRADFDTLIQGNRIIDEAFKGVKASPAGQQQTVGFPENSIRFIETMRSRIGDESEALKRAGRLSEARVYDQAYNDLKTLADQSVGGKYQQALTDYRRLFETRVRPLEAMPIEQLSGTSNLASQYAAVFTKEAAERNITPGKVRETMNALNASDPALAQEFVAQYMKSQFEQISPNVQRAKMRGAKFGDTVFGNETQKQNLLTAVQVAYGPDARTGFDTLLRSLKAQAERLPSGSPTAEKMAQAQRAEGLTRQVLQTPTKGVALLADYVVNGRDMEKMARALTSPDGIRELERLALAGKDKRKIGIAATSIQRLIDEAE